VSQHSVTSKDGTEIAYWTSGKGPPLVLVHGTPADHTRWRPLLPYLESHNTVHAMDRRGRGSSGDAEQYTLEREYEDVQAAKITVPVLLLTGENSADPAKADIETVAAAMPDARIEVLDSQEHVADILVPKAFSQYVMAFLRES
jgi:pimeloyl-ACP methyl ester carboxylesterase